MNHLTRSYEKLLGEYPGYGPGAATFSAIPLLFGIQVYSYGGVGVIHRSS